MVCGLYALAKPQQSIGETKSFSIPETKMLELLPEGIEDYVGLLDEEKYLPFRRYEGLDGFYVTNAKMMAPDGSDYRTPKMCASRTRSYVRLVGKLSSTFRARSI
ncbi:DUF2586 family protein [Paenibacillus melissococcoides]|nr:DUF2586 family protein [Paenibacillus melissococcoides]